MRPRAGVWARLWGSVCSPEAYRDAAASRVGGVVGYLAVLILLSSVVVTVQMQLGLAQAVRAFKAGKLWERDLPEIRITSGVASSPVAQPFRFERGNLTFILDTTGATSDLDPAIRQGLLLTKTDLIVRRQRRFGETRRYPLEQLPNMVLNQTTIERFLDQVMAWAWLVVALAMILWLWIAKLAQVLFWSLLGLIVAAASGRSLRYGALFNIGVLALTVPWAFDLVKDWFGWRDWSLPCLSMVTYVAYLIWGVLVQPVPVRADGPEASR